MAGQAVIVLSPGRSGSSMVAGILHRHGCWVGETRGPAPQNPYGFFENKPVQRAVYRRYGRDWLGPFPEPVQGWKAQVERLLQEQGYTGDKPWLFKGGTLYWRLWEPFEPLYVKLWRPLEDILASYERARFLRAVYRPHEVREIVSRQLVAAESIPGPDIDTDALVKGRRDQIKTAIERIGLEYRPDIVNDFVDSAAWSG